MSAATTPREARADEVLARLAADGFIERTGAETWKTTRRWQREMARTAARLYDEGDPGEDLRVPIAHVVVAFYDGRVADDELAELVEAIWPLELAALGLTARQGDAGVTNGVTQTA